MINPIDTPKFRTVKLIVIAFALGAIASSLVLDNRAGAIVKAFQNPQAVNGITFQVEVQKK